MSDTGRQQHSLLELLSERLLRHASVSVWRKVFLGGGPAVRFEQPMLTLLCSDAPARGWSLSELVLLAERFGGACEPCGDGEALFSFTQALPALRAALLLQKIGADTRVRSCITTGPCTVAVFEVDGQDRRMVLPPEVTRAEAGVRGAASGAIVISPEAYDLLEPWISDEVRDGLVATECHADAITQVSITLAPHNSEALSTFAGLGLS
jgi:hypothetical protein